MTHVFKTNNLQLGRMICNSKSIYKTKYPDNLVIFNSNVIIKSQGKVWYGDLDIDKDSNTLTAISKELNEDLYILYENDGRFENENIEIKSLINKHVVKITTTGEIIKNIKN